VRGAHPAWAPAATRASRDCPNLSGGAVEQTFCGWLGDVRIVDRPLRTDQFLIA
jgi:hypothetical protein